VRLVFSYGQDKKRKVLGLGYQ